MIIMVDKVSCDKVDEYLKDEHMANGDYASYNMPASDSMAKDEGKHFRKWCKIANKEKCPIIKDTCKEQIKSLKLQKPKK